MSWLDEFDGRLADLVARARAPSAARCSPKPMGV